MVDLDIIPIDDIKPHTPGVDCHCRPSVLTEGAVLIIVHNAYDNRETIENIEAFLETQNDPGI